MTTSSHGVTIRVNVPLEEDAIATTHKNFFRNTGKADLILPLYPLVSTRVSKVVYGSFIYIASDPNL